MQQSIVSRQRIVAAATRYGIAMGDGNVNPTEYYQRQVCPTSGTFSDLRVELSVAPGTGCSYTYTLRVNGVNTALTCAVSDTNTVGSDTAHTVDVVAGDILTIGIVPSGAAVSNDTNMVMTFTGSIQGESILMSRMGILSISANRYASIAGFCTTGATETDYKQIIPTSGTLKKLYVALSSDPGVTGSDAYTFTLRKDGVSQTLTCTITADNTTGNDTVNTVSVSAGNDVTLLIEPINTPAIAPEGTCCGMVFVADTDGESIILGGSTDALSNSATEYNAPIGQGATWDATEINRNLILNACVLKKLYMELDGVPYVDSETDDKYTFTLRSEAATTGITLAIAGNNTTGNDTVNTYSIADGESLSLQSVPNSSPNARDAYWGLVAYVAPGSSPSASVSASPSASPSASISNSPSVSESASPSTSPSASLSNSPSASISGSPSSSPSASISSSPSSSPSPSSSESSSPSASISSSPSASPSASISSSPSASPSASISASPSSSGSPSASISSSPSSSPSASVSASPSKSSSPSYSPSTSPSTSISASISASPSTSISSSPSASPSSSISASPTTSPSVSASASISASASASASAYPTDYACYLLNANKRTSQYSNYDFTGFGMFNQKLLGIKGTKIYDLTTVATHDVSTDIDAYIEIQTDFGVPNRKGIRSIYLEDGQATVTITDENGTAIANNISPDEFRALKRNLIDKSFTIKIQNISGEQITLRRIHGKLNLLEIKGG